MIRASFSRVVFRPRILAPALAICVAAFPHAAPAAFVADPAALYAEMKSAYDKGSTQGWSFRAQEYYFSAIVNAGRAYALQYPNDPAFAQLALLTVQTGSGITTIRWSITTRRRGTCGRRPTGCSRTPRIRRRWRARTR